MKTLKLLIKTVSMCPCVCLSHSWILSKRINISSNFFHHPHHSGFFCTKRHGVFRRDRTAPSPTGATDAGGGVSRNRDFEPISGFISCCQRCDQLDVINTVPPNRGKLWYLSLVVSGGVCWRETTTKYLDQKSNVTPNRQQNSIKAIINL